MSPLRRLVVFACWAAVTFAFVGALLPQAEAPHLGGSDKLDHMAAFFTICLFARLGYRWVPVWRIFVLAAALGAFIELCQMIPMLHRDAEWGDWIADIVACMLGIGAAWPILAWWRQWETEFP